jgi:hypothetical protein
MDTIRWNGCALQHYNIPTQYQKKNLCLRHYGIHVEYIGTASLLDEAEWLTSRLGRFTPGKGPQHPLIRMMDGTRAGLDVLENNKTFLLEAFEVRTVQLVA